MPIGAVEDKEECRQSQRVPVAMLEDEQDFDEDGVGIEGVR